ncbi:hypothetical protein MFIFM68171_07933 [Madurella fahalii]|uniref:Uncharacterized protein n=1 Tax=Madurella fahalii TaxID=1157608 RepID=A0ABQ0GIX5_9PEZI
MCWVRLVHFSLHDVRSLCATSPFTASDADHFTFSGVDRLCECGVDIRRFVDLASNAGFDVCPWHDCCVQWYQRVHCQWYWEEWATIPGIDNIQEPELMCENCVVVNEYHPFHLLAGDGNGEGLPEQFRVESAWTRTASDLPPFPTEIFYSHEIWHANPAPGTETVSGGLYGDRAVAQDLGVILYHLKSELNENIIKAMRCLDLVEREMDEEENVKAFAANPFPVLLRIKDAERYATKVSRFEWKAATCYRLMMQNTAFVLTYLNRMPGKGESLTSPDGLYTVTREQLDLGNGNVSDVFKACNGPLKQSGRIQRRLEPLREFLMFPKRSCRKPTQVPRMGFTHIQRNKRDEAKRIRRDTAPGMKRGK